MVSLCERDNRREGSGPDELFGDPEIDTDIELGLLIGIEILHCHIFHLEQGCLVEVVGISLEEGLNKIICIE